jgi:hypothetical protein
MRKYLRRPLVKYDFATPPSEFPYIWGKFEFLCYQCREIQRSSTRSRQAFSRRAKTRTRSRRVVWLPWYLETRSRRAFSRQAKTHTCTRQVVGHVSNSFGARLAIWCLRDSPREWRQWGGSVLAGCGSACSIWRLPISSRCPHPRPFLATQNINSVQSPYLYTF